MTGLSTGLPNETVTLPPVARIVNRKPRFATPLGVPPLYGLVQKLVALSVSIVPPVTADPDTDTATPLTVVVPAAVQATFEFAPARSLYPPTSNSVAISRTAHRRPTSPTRSPRSARSLPATSKSSGIATVHNLGRAHAPRCGSPAHDRSGANDPVCASKTSRFDEPTKIVDDTSSSTSREREREQATESA
jgi:hypothetical protein